MCVKFILQYHQKDTHYDCVTYERTKRTTKKISNKERNKKSTEGGCTVCRSLHPINSHRVLPTEHRARNTSEEEPGGGGGGGGGERHGSFHERAVFARICALVSHSRASFVAEPGPYARRENSLADARFPPLSRPRPMRRRQMRDRECVSPTSLSRSHCILE